MQHQMIDTTVEIFSTCPQSAEGDRKEYLERVIAVARWSEEYGCKGILVYSDNRLVDPWLVSQVILQHTETLCPLVAVQPIYMHPYVVAKMATTFSFFYGRQIYLNMVAGGFKNDLTALNDLTPHDKRYSRLTEYTRIIKELLNGGSVTHKGEFYEVANLKLTPTLSKDLFPGIFISGSSQAGLDACQSVGATAIKYPKSSAEEVSQNGDRAGCGVRVGIITRDHEEEAWAIAYERFPEDRKGQLTHQMAMKTSDSIWHKQLSNLGQETRTGAHPYWLVPFENYKTFCPYLVGSYDKVSYELAKYIALGYTTFILDIPPNEEELHHTHIAFKQALERAR